MLKKIMLATALALSTVLPAMADSIETWGFGRNAEIVILRDGATIQNDMVVCEVLGTSGTARYGNWMKALRELKPLPG
jgi:hypothetical protein